MFSLEDLQSSACSQPPYYQFQRRDCFEVSGLENEILGDWVHQNIDIRVRNDSQKRIGRLIQFKGARCGIRKPPGS